MSIKQGDYLKKLRTDRGLSQERLADALAISRQSISKWEQGISSPDIENIKKLSEFFGVSADSLVHGEPDAQAAYGGEEPKAEKKQKKKRGWFFTSFPIIMIIVYCILGFLFPPQGWYIGWTVLLLIPLFYTAVYAAEKKNPLIFCYPVLVVLIYMLCGLCLGKWHPAWIIFLTIPIYYIIAAKAGKHDD